MQLSRPLSLGMVGGGPGSFIGPVHRMAAELDGQFRLVAGAFSSDPERSRLGGERYGIATERTYADYRHMFEAEAEKLDAIAIVTPNHLHLPVARAALERGFHVICDKPATATLSEALELRNIVEASGRLYALTFTYTGYSMIREARAMVERGVLGPVRKVVVEYLQGWLAQPVEKSDNKQAEWRVDPARSGVGGCVGDIGVHAFNVLEYVSGQRVASFVADLPSVVPGRKLDDDCTVLLRFDQGQPGVLMASQIATGERNGLKLRVYGERGGLIWHHERPDLLTYERGDGRTELLHAGDGCLATKSRLPPGHPEGFIEAFATLYSDFGAAIGGRRELIDTTVPGITAGIRSMAFIEKTVAASRARAGWTPFHTEEF